MADMMITGGKPFSLKDLKGQRTVLYFYPKDNTAGCAREGADFAAAAQALAKLGVRILGVSKDTLASHEKFKAKMKFPFELVSDPAEILCRHFDVIHMKSLYGKKYEGIVRSTFVLSEKGKIEQEWRKVKVPGHVDEVLTYVKAST